MQGPSDSHHENAIRDTARKVLFLAQLPPPLHGASAMSKRAYDIMTARGDLMLTHLWQGGAATVQDVGQRSPAKLIAFIAFLADLAWRYVTGKRYAIGYLTLAPFSHAALRDGLLIAMSKLLARRTLVHLHAEGLDLVMAGAGWPRKILRRLIAGVELITITQKVAGAVGATQHFKAVHLLPNCVADPGPPALGTATALRCGYLANLDPRKGTLRFLDCIEEMKRQGLPVTARIAGPSTATLTIAQLEADVQRRGLSGLVEVVGPLYGADKTAFLSSVDLFIYLSRRDYFPLVVIEAMSCGAVPIVYDNEGEAELVGAPFAANVVPPALEREAMAARVADIARGYHERRADLARGRETARARYLACYTPDRFRVRLDAILDA